MTETIYDQMVAEAAMTVAQAARFSAQAAPISGTDVTLMLQADDIVTGVIKPWQASVEVWA